jgi:hypothetical protein
MRIGCVVVEACIVPPTPFAQPLLTKHFFTFCPIKTNDIQLQGHVNIIIIKIFAAFPFSSRRDCNNCFIIVQLIRVASSGLPTCVCVFKKGYVEHNIFTYFDSTLFLKF